MTKEELKQLLKESLEVRMYIRQEFGYDSLSIELRLDGEVISEDWDAMPRCEHETYI